MSRKYLNDRWCARCGRNTPTPYLVKNISLLPEKGRVLDIGCGNGRNSKHLNLLNYTVDSVDMVGDFGIQMVLGKDDLPDQKYDVILANYILMFLNNAERKKVMKQINERARVGCVLMIEMYDAKDSHPFNFDDIVEFFFNRGWEKLRKSKDKCVLKKNLV